MQHRKPQQQPPTTTFRPCLPPAPQRHFPPHGGIRELAIHISGARRPQLQARFGSSAAVQLGGRCRRCGCPGPVPPAAANPALPLPAPPRPSLPLRADQRVSQGKTGAAPDPDAGDKGIVVVGASVVPLTLAQREELGALLGWRAAGGRAAWGWDSALAAAARCGTCACNRQQQTRAGVAIFSFLLPPHSFHLPLLQRVKSKKR